MWQFFLPRDHLAKSGDTFLLSQVGGRVLPATGEQRLGMLPYILLMYGYNSHNQEVLGLTRGSSEVEKPCDRKENALVARQ